MFCMWPQTVNRDNLSDLYKLNLRIESKDGPNNSTGIDYSRSKTARL